jgi:xylulokinase
LVLAVDVGTSTLKAALFDERASLLGIAQAETPLVRVAGGYEVDAGVWLRALRDAVARLGSGVRSRASAIVVSGNGPTVVPVDAGGTPLHRALLWMDGRGQEEARAAAAGADAAAGVDTSFFLSKVLWFSSHRPEVMDRVASFLGCPEFVAAWLTGERCAILPTPEYERYYWTAKAARALGIEPRLLPTAITTGQRVGRLLPAAAADLDLPAGLPVVGGGPDFIVSLLGTATVDLGSTNDRAGSSEGVNRCSTAAVADMRLLCLPHIVPGRTNVSGLISTSGKAIDWLRGACGRAGGGYEELFAAAAGAPAGARRLLFLPYLAGERTPHWDPLARGAFVGLTLAHSWGDLARSVLESIGFAIRDVLEVMEEHALTVAEMRVAGTQARADTLNRIKADITGRSLLVPEVPESELMGDACVGLAALGVHGDPVEAARACVRIERRFDPDPALRAVYDDLYGLYREAYRALKGLFPRLGEGA